MLAAMSEHKTSLRAASNWRHVAAVFSDVSFVFLPGNTRQDFVMQSALVVITVGPIDRATPRTLARIWFAASVGTYRSGLHVIRTHTRAEPIVSGVKRYERKSSGTLASRCCRWRYSYETMAVQIGAHLFTRHAGEFFKFDKALSGDTVLAPLVDGLR